MWWNKDSRLLASSRSPAICPRRAGALDNQRQGKRDFCRAVAANGAPGKRHPFCSEIQRGEILRCVAVSDRGACAGSPPR